MKNNESNGVGIDAAPHDSRQQMLAKVGAALVAATAASATPAAAAPVLKRLSFPPAYRPVVMPSVVVEKGVKLVCRNVGHNYNVFLGEVFDSKQEGLVSAAIVDYQDQKSTQTLMKQLSALPATASIVKGVVQISIGPGNGRCTIVVNTSNIASFQGALTPPIGDQGASITGNQKH